MKVLLHTLEKTGKPAWEIEGACVMASFALSVTDPPLPQIEIDPQNSMQLVVVGYNGGK